MALTDTPWIGYGDDKLYLQSGQFTSTIKSSVSVTGIDTVPYGISWDGTNTPWGGNTDDKLYLQSGQHTSTLKTSQSITGFETSLTGISWDGTNTPYTGLVSDKLLLQSGQFTSTLKTSEYMGTSFDAIPSGISYDANNTPWTGQEADKLYLQSGQFTSTLKTSEAIVAIDKPSGISWDDTNTLWAGNIDNKLYLQSGQFTSTIKTSEDVSVVEGFTSGIETNDVNARITGDPNITVTPTNLALTTGHGGHNIFTACNIFPATLTLGLSQEDVSINAGTDVFIVLSALALGINVASVAPTILGDAFILLPDTSMILLALGLSTHAPTINITNDIKILVTNTRNFAITEYSNFAFNSMCQFNGKYLYAKSDGIYEGGGNNDNGTQIVASYKTGAIDTYTTEIQRLRDAYLTFRSDGDVQLFSVGDEINARAYYITGSPATTIHERRVKFERGIKDRHINMGISNVNGSTLEVDSIKVLTEPIRKRR